MLDSTGTHATARWQTLRTVLARHISSDCKIGERRREHTEPILTKIHLTRVSELGGVYELCTSPGRVSEGECQTTHLPRP